MSNDAAPTLPPIGVLLAAGRSVRMGRPKQLLALRAPEGEKPLVAAAFDSVRDACSQMIVVVGHEAAAVKRALGGREFQAVRGEADAEMIESVRLGLRAAQAARASSCVLLHLGDHPCVSPGTLQSLMEAHNGSPDRAILPTFKGRGGHPILIPPSLVPELLEYTGLGGLRTYWRRHPDRCLRLPVEDPGVARDIDRPGDYAIATGG